MPFTPAHAAIVLPFIRRRKFSATGLIVGSMAPDFEYFFRMNVTSAHSHTIAGIFYFDIPVVVFLAFVFHLVVKRNLILNLPVFLQRRFYDTLQVDFIAYIQRHWIVFLCSAAAGTASHILWDNFTHASGYFVRVLPFYHATKVLYNGVRYPWFFVLQHVSTAAGLLVILLYILYKTPAPFALAKPDNRYWILLILITAATVGARYSVYAADMAVGNIVVSIISGLCLAVIINGFINFKTTTMDAA